MIEECAIEDIKISLDVAYGLEKSSKFAPSKQLV